MDFAAMINGTASWLEGSGQEPNIVVSSRIRLARNIVGVPFPHWADELELENVYNQVEGAINKIDFSKPLELIPIKTLSAIDRQILVERHLVSSEHTECDGFPAVAISQDEQVSVMVNEEDHLRLQVISSGLQLDKTWELMNNLDNEMSSCVEYAFNSQYGFLTSCPTNVGTGLRASVMMHLPGLVMLKQIDQVLRAVTKLGLTVRGWYGEGSEISGNLFQVSNQVTLGKKETDVILNLEQVIKQILEHEKNARHNLMMKSSVELHDKIGRAFGILKYSNLINSTESLEHLSTLRTGIEQGILKSVNVRIINELFLLTQPAHIQKIAGKKLPDKERDIKRAALIREMMREEKFE